MNRFIKTIDNQRGGLSLEAAIVLPVIIGAFFVLANLMHMQYIHAKVQLNLNRICNAYMYDSYFLEEAQVFQGIQEFSEHNQEVLSFDEINELMELQVPLNKKVDGLSFETFEDFYDTSGQMLEAWVELSEVYKRVSATAKSESSYLIGSAIGRFYFQKELNEVSESLGIGHGIQIEHLDGFSNGAEGLIIVSYKYDIPFHFIGDGEVSLQNSCSLQSFAGCEDLNIKYHKAIETSEYGRGDGQSKYDDDGYLRQVYVTPKGQRYHRDRTCYHISVNFHMILPQNVGNRKPCNKCGDSGKASSFGYYYVTDGSDVYHKNPECTALSHHIETMSEKDAIGRGLTACKSCLNRRLIE